MGVAFRSVKNVWRKKPGKAIFVLHFYFQIVAFSLSIWLSYMKSELFLLFICTKGTIIKNWCQLGRGFVKSWDQGEIKGSCVLSVWVRMLKNLLSEDPTFKTFRHFISITFGLFYFCLSNWVGMRKINNIYFNQRNILWKETMQTRSMHEILSFCGNLF